MPTIPSAKAKAKKLAPQPKPASAPVSPEPAPAAPQKPEAAARPKVKEKEKAKEKDKEQTTDAAAPTLVPAPSPAPKGKAKQPAKAAAPQRKVTAGAAVVTAATAVVLATDEEPAAPAKGMATAKGKGKGEAKPDTRAASAGPKATPARARKITPPAELAAVTPPAELAAVTPPAELAAVTPPAELAAAAATAAAATLAAAQAELPAALEAAGPAIVVEPPAPDPAGESSAQQLVVTEIPRTNGAAPATVPELVELTLPPVEPTTPAPAEAAPRPKARVEVVRTEEDEPEPPTKPQPLAPETPKPSPVLTHKTQEIFARLREEVGFPILAYWTSSTGSICQNDVMAMSHLLAEAPQSDTVGLFLKSDGGNPEAALRLVHLLRNIFKRIVLFAPFECASAATMVALGSNEVHMGRTSYLTAVDTSLKHQLSPVDHGNDLVSVSQDEVSRILRLWKEHKSGGNPYPEVYKYLHPLVIGALDRSSSLSIRICAELLSYHLKDKTRSEAISRELNSSYPSHSYPITATEARRLGLNVRDLNPAVEKSLRELNVQYSTMAHPLITDFDEGHYHINEICNILEINGRQIFYSVNKDWYYRKEERRWSPMKDKSSWKSVVKSGRKWKPTTFFIR